MRVLLVHPEDSPIAGEWSDSHWDLVVDLGWAGTAQYGDWSEKLGCPIRGLYSYAEWRKDVRHIHEIFQAGNGCLVDAEGIDWWKLLARLVFQNIFEFQLLLKIAGEVQPSAEVRVTRPHPLTDTLGKQLRVKITPFNSKAKPVSAWASRYTKALQTLTSGQIAGIAFDKWDTDYRVRRFLHRPKRDTNQEQRVLLPSSYSNVSRVLAAYAKVLPDRHFLLVTTRRNGAIHDLPCNVVSAPLAAYAPLPRNKSTEREIAALIEKWRGLQRRLQESKNHEVAFVASSFTDFARILRAGMRVRDAWREVLDRERISSVLCGDENNPYTRLPVLLAKSRGVQTVHCSHGALDVNLLIHGVCSDTYLAKGEMEKDYMMQECEVPEERIAPGAPPMEHFFSKGEPREPGDRIVFFSEPYELYGGRTETLYRELLPKLCAIARRYGRKVVLKLHPYESAVARSRLIEEILTVEDRQLVEVSSAPISEQLLRRVWFGLAVESSVALECALAGIPFFLCAWFDLNLHCYGRQYEKFGAARALSTPSAVLRIPQIIESHPTAADSQNLFYPPITQVELDGILQSAEGLR